MFTIEKAEKLKLGIQNIDEKMCMLIESGLLWLKSNTKLDIDIDSEEALQELPANVRLFLCKYIEIMQLRPGIASESISNLSQSFVTDTKDLLWQAAGELLGEDALNSGITFTTAKRRWRK